MIVFLIDADNLNSSSWVNEAFQKIEESEGRIAVRRAYGSAESLKVLTDVFRTWVVRPFLNLSLSKNTTDVALAVDAMELTYQSPQPTTVVIGSGDADFVPLVVRLRERGIRVVCVSESKKVAIEAVYAYDKMIFVGKEPVLLSPVVPDAVVPLKTVVKKVPVKKVVAKTAQVVKAPAKKVAAKKTAIPKLVAPIKTAIAKTDGAVQLQHILDAAPLLLEGQSLQLSDVVKLLHDAKVLGKSAASTKLFSRFPHHFELTPQKQPNKVRYILPPA